MSLRDAVTTEEAWEVKRAAKLYLSAVDSFILGGILETPLAGRKIAAMTLEAKKSIS
jgi:hypothetical protein